MQISRGFERRNEQKVTEIFARHADFNPTSIARKDMMGRHQPVRPCEAAAWLITKSKMRKALEDLDVIIKDAEVDHVFYMMDIDDNKGLDLAEFAKAIQACFF